MVHSTLIECIRMYRNKTIRDAPETCVQALCNRRHRRSLQNGVRRDRTRASYRRARRIRAESAPRFAATLSSAYRFVSHNDRVHLPLVRTCIEITFHNVCPQQIRALNRCRSLRLRFPPRACSRSYDAKSRRKHAVKPVGANQSINFATGKSRTCELGSQRDDRCRDSVGHFSFSLPFVASFDAGLFLRMWFRFARQFLKSENYCF
jgi:hypothetical protein